MLRTLFFALILVFNINNLAIADEQNIPFAGVDINKIRTETKAGKSMLIQLEELQTKFKAQVAKMQKDWDVQKAELDKQKNILSKEAYAKKEKSSLAKFNDLRKDVQNDAARIEKMQQNANDEFNKVAIAVLRDIAKKNNFQGIISLELLLYADPKIDITSQVVAKIDEKIDHITVKELPKETEAAVEQ